MRILDDLIESVKDIFTGRRKNAPRPASEDPYGDPADQKPANNTRPASEDPYGDPADEEQRR